MTQPSPLCMRDKTTQMKEFETIEMTSPLISYNFSTGFSTNSLDFESLAVNEDPKLAWLLLACPLTVGVLPSMEGCRLRSGRLFGYEGDPSSGASILTLLKLELLLSAIIRKIVVAVVN